MTASDFGIWLKRTMYEHKITGRELAQKINVSDSAVSRWLSGDQAPSMKVLGRLAATLDVDPLPLYVRAGRLSEEEAGVPPAPLPPPKADREKFEAMVIKSVPGVSRKSVMALMETYDTIMEQETE